jgi:hypothetical protein
LAWLVAYAALCGTRFVLAATVTFASGGPFEAAWMPILTIGLPAQLVGSALSNFGRTLSTGWAIGTLSSWALVSAFVYLIAGPLLRSASNEQLATTLGTWLISLAMSNAVFIGMTRRFRSEAAPREMEVQTNGSTR